MTEFQKRFLEEMDFEEDRQLNRSLFLPKDKNKKGYFIVHHSCSYQFVAADYKITKDFQMDFDSRETYLRLGVIEKGISKYTIQDKSFTEFSPAPFLVMEDKISGHQTWEMGHHYKGTELIFPLNRLKKTLLQQYPEMAVFLKLKDNFIYYYLPIEAIHILDELHRLALNQQLSPLYLDASVYKCLALLVKELSETENNNFTNEYNYSVLNINQMGSIRLTQNDLKGIRAAHNLILQRLENPPPISTLCKTLFMSEQKLTLGFKKVYGKSIGNYIIEQRLILGAKLLTTTDLSVNDIGKKVGYTHTSNFAKAFKKKYLKNPLQFRKVNH